ncbi:hypothetical protein D1872_291810 [compost metagenome]
MNETVLVSGVNNAVFTYILFFHCAHADHLLSSRFVNIHHLTNRRGGGIHNIIAQQHGEGLIANELTSAADRMSQAEGFFLTDIVNDCFAPDALNFT